MQESCRNSKWCDVKMMPLAGYKNEKRTAYTASKRWASAVILARMLPSVLAQPMASMQQNNHDQHENSANTSRIYIEYHRIT